MTESEAIDGTVERVTDWKTGKGYFLKLEGVNLDYYGFGKPKCKDGDKIQLHFEPGTGNFTDKLSIKKVVILSESTSPPVKSPDAPGQQDLFSNKHTVQTSSERTNAINKAVAFKGAIELVKNTVQNKPKLPMEEAAANVIGLSRRFELYLNSEEESEK